MYDYLRQIYDFYGAYGIYPYSQPYGEYDPFPYAYLSSYYYMPQPNPCCDSCCDQDPCCDQNPYYDQNAYYQPFPGSYGNDAYGYMQPQEAFIY